MAQHQAQMKEQKTHIAYLEGLFKTEVQTHKEANAALQQTNQEQATPKRKVQTLSKQLQVALDQIHNMSVDLVTTRSLLDARPRRQQDDGRANTSKGQKSWSMASDPKQEKGKKTPSLASNRKAPSRGP